MLVHSPPPRPRELQTYQGLWPFPNVEQGGALLLLLLPCACSSSCPLCAEPLQAEGVGGRKAGSQADFSLQAPVSGKFSLPPSLQGRSLHCLG